MINTIILIDSAAGLRKKLEKAAKEKDCTVIGKWQRSIINHLYWSVSSTSDGDPNMMLAKWLSLENHIHNQHRHQNKKFPKCFHGRRNRRDKKKQWLKRRKSFYY